MYSITISEGCSNNCSYCAIHFATGQLKSRPIQNIIDEMKNAIKNGYKYFRIQCENSGSYGTDIGSSIGDLLNQMSAIHDEFYIDLPDMHPYGFVNNLESILNFINKKKVYLLHLPLQSGSQRILNAMKRNYDIEAVKLCLAQLFHEHPDLRVGTDIIVGFPGEEEIDFLASFELLKSFPFSPIYIHGFCEKEGTSAFDLPNKVDDLTKIHRIKRMYSEFSHAACYLNDYRREDTI